MNILVIYEDINLINKIKNFTVADKSANWCFFQSTNEAIEYFLANEVDVVILPVVMSIINGDEMTDMFIAKNNHTDFLCLYNSDEIDLAVEYLNRYDDVRVLNTNSLRQEVFYRIIDSFAEHKDDEKLYNERFLQFKKKEEAYKSAINDMSSIINSRLICYQQVVNVYSKSVCAVLDKLNDSDKHSIKDYIQNNYNDYVQNVLLHHISFSECKDSLNNILHKPSEMKYYSYISECRNIEYALYSKICFVSYFVSRAFAEFLDKYRIKLELVENNKSFKLDMLTDTKMMNADKKTVIEILCSVIVSLGQVFASKFEHASKDGIIQYRFYFNKNE